MRLLAVICCIKVRFLLLFCSPMHGFLTLSAPRKNRSLAEFPDYQLIVVVVILRPFLRPDALAFEEQALL